MNNRKKPECCRSTATERTPVRVLCLGNDLVADDSVGTVVAGYIREFARENVEVVSTPESGFHLLDYVTGAQTLIVVDTIMTGTAVPGTIYEIRPQDMKTAFGGSAHYVGLCETLALAKRLELPVADEVMIVAIEAADCSTVGGEMHPAVRGAIPEVVNRIRSLLAGISPGQ